MIIKTRDLINITDSKIYDIDIENIYFDNNMFVKEINNVKGYIEFYYDESDTLFMHYSLDCNIIAPGSLTPEDISFDEHFEDDEPICFKEVEEGFYIKDDSTDIDIIKSIVLPVIPIKADNSSEIMHKEGDGWIITSEKEYAKINKEKVDPRLEVLKKYKEEK